MGEHTKIEWADHTWNLWEGCTRVSEGCRHCYAEARNARFGGGEAPNWGPGAPRRLTSVATWMQVEKWQRQAVASGERPRIFVNSLSDILDPEVDAVWLAKGFAMMRRASACIFMLLSKRPRLWRERVQAAHDAAARVLDDPATALWLSDWLEGAAPENVWVGTTVESPARAERVAELLLIPAIVRFLSCEPLLGAVDLVPWLFVPDPQGGPSDLMPRNRLTFQPSLDWVICGGESGDGARPMHPDWARSLRDQCAAAGVAFFLKQMGGARKPFPEILTDLMVRQFPEGSR